MNTIVALLFVVLYKIFDELQQHSEKNEWPITYKYANWLNTETGWRNKHNWKPNWLFKKSLVFTTDGEHFFQMLKNLSVSLAITSMNWNVVSFIIVHLTILMTSYLMNEIILKK